MPEHPEEHRYRADSIERSADSHVMHPSDEMQRVLSQFWEFRESRPRGNMKDDRGMIGMEASLAAKRRFTEKAITVLQAPEAQRNWPHISWYLHESNTAKSDEILGEMYYHGIGEARDLSQAIRYLHRAGTPRARFVLEAISRHFLLGDDMPRSFSKAARVMELASTPQSLLNAGLIQLSGFGMQRDPAKAVDNLKRSSLTEAHELLGLLYHDGELINRNRSKSIYHFKKAKTSDTMYVLAEIYREPAAKRQSPDLYKAACHLTASKAMAHADEPPRAPVMVPPDARLRSIFPTVEPFAPTEDDWRSIVAASKPSHEAEQTK